MGAEVAISSDKALLVETNDGRAVDYCPLLLCSLNSFGDKRATRPRRQNPGR